MEKVVRGANILAIALLNLTGAVLTWIGKYVEMYAPGRFLAEYWYPLCILLSRLIPSLKVYLTPTYTVGALMLILVNGYLIWSAIRSRS